MEAAVAGPPSPEYPAEPLPTMVEMTPAVVTLPDAVVEGVADVEIPRAVKGEPSRIGELGGGGRPAIAEIAGNFAAREGRENAV